MSNETSRIAEKASEYQILKMRKLSDIPNQLGFKFLGITRGRTVVELEIVERPDCAFCVSDNMYPYLIGWVKIGSRP